MGARQRDRPDGLPRDRDRSRLSECARHRRLGPERATRDAAPRQRINGGSPSNPISYRLSRQLARVEKQSNGEANNEH
jgi:hypothetical protein